MKIRGRAAGKAAENKEKIRTKIRGRYVAAFIIAAICLAVLVPFAKGLMTPKQQPPEEAVLTVQEEYPAIRSIQNTARVVGNVKSDDARTIIAKAAGEVVTLNVSEGDQVSAGDIICIIDSDSLTSSMLSRDSAQSSVSSAQIQVENSRLQVKNAQNDLKDAKENVEKYSILYEDGSISKAEMESYEKAVTNAESQLSSAENSLSQAQYSLQQAQYSYEMACDSYNTLYDSLYVKATSAGVIESLDIDLHDNITAQTKICTISQKTQMKLVCSVASSVASEISAGDDVTVTQKGNTYAGTIESVGSDADASTGTYEVKILLADASEMAVNSKATAYLKTKKSDQALTVPYSCVYYDEGKPYVYVDTDGTAAVRYIETGIHDDNYIAVTGGLNENDAVITSWSSSLTGGSLVQKAVNE